NRRCFLARTVAAGECDREGPFRTVKRKVSAATGFRKKCPLWNRCRIRRSQSRVKRWRHDRHHATGTGWVTVTRERSRGMPRKLSLRARIGILDVAQDDGEIVSRGNF